LYGKEKLKSVNSARYDIFRLRFRIDAALPPNKDSLLCHLKRANYQAAIHRRSLQQNIEVPSPLDHGWEAKDGGLSVVWNTIPFAPDCLLKYISCRCKRSGCTGGRCSCREHSLLCTELCSCEGCGNSDSAEQDIEDTDVASDDEADEEMS